MIDNERSAPTGVGCSSLRADSRLLHRASTGAVDYISFWTGAFANSLSHSVVLLYVYAKYSRITMVIVAAQK